MAIAGGQNAHAGRIVIVAGTGQKHPPEPGKKGNRIMTRNIPSLILLTTLAAAAVSLNAEPTPSADRTSIESPKPQAKTKVVPKIVPAPPLAEGWSYVKGEWIHSEGYKYVKGQVIRTGAQTHKSPPKPPSKALLNSVKTKPGPSPDPNSAAAKAAQKERNLTPRPASQTGTHL
jgi:hypothetical protein